MEVVALIIIAILILLLIVGLALMKQSEQLHYHSSSEGTKLPYQRRPIMTQTELKVYDLLLQALPKYMIFSQVQVSRVLQSPQQNNEYWFNLICRLSYDFVVCRLDGTPIATIEVDDDSHALPERQRADQKKDHATAAAGIKMLRWDVRAIPDAKAILKKIKEIDKAA